MEVETSSVDKVISKYPFLFTTYIIDNEDANGYATYVSKDGAYVMAFCDGKWIIQRAMDR